MANEVEIIVTAKDKASGAFKSAESGAKGLKGGLQKAQGAARASVLGLLAVGGAASKQASDLQQADGAVESVYKNQSSKVKELASTSADRLGLSASEYEQFSATAGAQLKNLGFDQDGLAGKTDNLLQMGADLAATYGGSTSDAVEALGSVFRGEYDSIEKYGISIKQSDINSKLAAKGQDKLKGKALKNAQAQAALGMLTKQSADAHGQFARESDTAAGSQQRAAAAMKDAGAKIATALLPFIAKLLDKLAKMADWLGKHPKLVAAMAGAIGILAAAIIAVNTAMKIKMLFDFAKGLQGINLALLANPIVLIVAGIIAFIAIVIIAYKKSETFRNIVNGAFRMVKKVVMGVVNWFKNSFVPFFTKKIPAAAQKVLDWIKKNWPKILIFLGGPLVWAIAFIVKKWDRIKEIFSNGIHKIFSWFRELPGKIRGAFSNLAGIISGPFRSAFQGIKDFWNRYLGGKGFTAPSWIPGIGGKGFHIPYLASGGMASGLAVVGERGRELVNLPAGSHVRPSANAEAALRGGNGRVVIEIKSGGSKMDDMLVEMLRKSIRVRGGNVQVVLGK